MLFQWLLFSTSLLQWPHCWCFFDVTSITNMTYSFAAKNNLYQMSGFQAGFLLLSPTECNTAVWCDKITTNQNIFKLLQVRSEPAAPIKITWSACINLTRAFPIKWIHFTLINSKIKLYSSPESRTDVIARLTSLIKQIIWWDAF